MTVGEQTPLLISRAESADAFAPSPRSGSATVTQTVVNICKTCMGTGTLALPYAAQQGGLLLHVFGLIGICAWNVYSVQRLLDCLDLLPSCRQQENNKQHHHFPPPGTSTLGKVAWFSLGRKGLIALDIVMVMLLAGIVITYEDAIRSFLNDTPFFYSPTWNAIVTGLLIGLLSIVPDMSHLARASATGLTVLFLTFLIICSYGTYSGDNAVSVAILLPRNGMSGVSTWFGCIVFGFGMVPLTYNMQEAMAEPQRMMGATCIGLVSVAVSYGVVGIGLLMLYPNIEGDLLQELPASGVVPTMVRLAMVVVVMATAPLLVVPCGELLEGKVSCTFLSESALRVCVRLGICLVCSIISVTVPGFVQVLSFVGCCCVALVSFVVPPTLHLVLLHQQQQHSNERRPHDSVRTRQTQLLDLAMLTWGISATVITSLYTLGEMTTARK